MIKYIKFYLEPNRKDVFEMARLACKEWFAVNPSRKSISNFQAFTRAYESQYRHDYAKSKLKGGI